MAEEVVLGADRWRHRLQLRMNPPVDAPGGVWTEDILRSALNRPVPPIELFGEDRRGYFLNDYVIEGNGEVAFLTLDFYELEGIGSEPPGEENDDRKRHEERQPDSEETEAGNGGQDVAAGGLTVVRDEEIGRNGHDDQVTEP